MSETPKWLTPVLAGVLGIGGTGGAVESFDLFGHQATAAAHQAERAAVETTNAAFLSHIKSCETSRTESREVALQMIADHKQTCSEDKAALRELITR